MGMLDWFKSILRGEEPATRAPAAAARESAGAEVAGLNFKTAIDAHMKWKIRLDSYISGASTEDLKVEVVCRDDQCPLGKWIYDKGGEKFGYSETFYEMKIHHAHFHRCAGMVVAAAQAGDTANASRMLNTGDYVRASERVKTLLARMFVMASEGREALDSHIRWKSRLKHFIVGDSTEILSIDQVRADDQCTLGKWIKGIGGQRFGDTPEFAALRAHHTYFHGCAGEILATAARGEKELALRMLESGVYPAASERVAEAIVALFERQDIAEPSARR